MAMDHHPATVLQQHVQGQHAALCTASVSIYLHVHPRAVACGGAGHQQLLCSMAAVVTAMLLLSCETRQFLETTFV